MAQFLDKLSLPKLPSLNFRINSPSQNHVEYHNTSGTNNVVNASRPAKVKTTVSNLVGIQFPVRSFEGRVEILDELSRNIDESITQQIQANYCDSYVQVVSGVGGVGKTETVRKYIANNCKKFARVVWIEAENYKNVINIFKRLAENFCIQITADEKDENIAGKVFAAACKKSKRQSEMPTVFIFDNVHEIEDSSHKIVNLFPKSLCHTIIPLIIIVTTRQKTIDTYATVELKGFTEDESWNLLKTPLELESRMRESKRQGPLTNDEKQKIHLNRKLVCELSKLYEGLPLVMQQVIAFIQKENEFRCTKYTLKDFLTKVKQQQPLLLITKPKTCDIQESVFLLYELTTTKLLTQPNGQVALNCLDVMALLNPDSIPYKLVQGLMKHTHNDVLKSAIKLLKSFGLLTDDNDKCEFKIHRVVQLVRKMSESFTVRTSTFSNNCRVLSLFNSKFVSTKEVINNYAIYIENVFECLEWKECDNGLILFQNVIDKINSDTAFKCIDTVVDKMHQTLCAGNETLSFLQIALHKAEKDDTRSVFKRRIKLANEYFRVSKYQEAINLYSQAIVELTKLKNPKHRLELLQIKECVAHVYKAQGKYHESATEYEDILLERNNLQCQNHKDILATKANLAFVFQQQGENNKAKDLYNDLITELEKQLENTDQATLELILELAMKLDNQIKYKEASELHEDLVTKKDSCLVFSNSMYLGLSFSTIYAMVVKYGNQTDEYKAVNVIKHLVSLWENDQGPVYPSYLLATVKKLDSMAAVFENINDDENAKSIYLRLQLLQDHVGTKYSLARVHKRLGNREEAKALEAIVLTDLQNLSNIAGSDSWETRSEKANLEAQRGNYAYAETIYKYNLVEHEFAHVLSSENERITKLNLAGVLVNLKNYTHAEVLYKELSSCTLSNWFFEKLKAQYGLALVMYHQRKYEKADHLYMEIIPTLNELGDEYTEVAKKNLEDIRMQLRNIAENNLLKLLSAPDARLDIRQYLKNKQDLAILRYRLGQVDDAERLYNEVISEMENLLGRSHPDTMLSKRHLQMMRSTGNKRESQNAINVSMESEIKKLKLN